VDREHSLQKAIHGEIDSESFFIDRVLLLLELVRNKIPIPKLHLGISRTGESSLYFLKFCQFFIVLWLKTDLEFFQEIQGVTSGFSHPGFSLVIGPRLIAEERRQLCAQRN